MDRFTIKDELPYGSLDLYLNTRYMLLMPFLPGDTGRKDGLGRFEIRFLICGALRAAEFTF